ncbi:MAG: hypothetical protein BWY78_00884 [Alphaproteobacteria bacterium ADurb.Bin438]|nr:MAG: hypothetical protein BWY78_00884 [Alphaproteobacteria bacterium ADurb.Bin438]
MNDINQDKFNNKKLALEVNRALSRVAQDLKSKNIPVIMPTYAPQRGDILTELANKGVDTLIAGGVKGAKCFKDIPQYGIDEDTAPYIGVFPSKVTEKIVNAIPENKIKDREVVVFSYINSLGWGEEIKKRNLNTKIVGTVEQSLRKYFEEKGNLIKILDTAGLEDYKIPTKHIDDNVRDEDLKKIYKELKSKDGKVVIQGCRSKIGSGGGKGTQFASSEEEFLKIVKDLEGEKKVVKFIKGVESNLSFFAGNTVASNDSYGAKKTNLEGLDPFDTKTLDKLLEKTKQGGVNEENIVTVVGRGTLKAVGDENLTSNEANGVGNDIGYVFEEKIRNQIKEVGQKLSKIMALSGKVGLAGADLIIDESGKVYINEINDRQQGPTSQMSIDAENNGIPSISKISLVSSYANFNDKHVKDLFNGLKKHSESINEAYTTSRGEFYLKVNSTHDKGLRTVSHNVVSGYYDLIKDEKGNFKFDPSSRKDKAEYKTDTTKDVITIKIEGADLKKGDELKSGSQLFRITGQTDAKTPPFIIKEGRTVLNNDWKKVVYAVYSHVFYEGYTKENPLLNKKNKEKELKTNSALLYYVKNQRQV